MLIQTVIYIPNATITDATLQISRKVREILRPIKSTELVIGHAVQADHNSVISNGTVVKTLTWQNREDMDHYNNHDLLRESREAIDDLILNFQVILCACAGAKIVLPSAKYI